MLRVEYKIITDRFREIEYISDEKIRYDFLLGNISLLSFNAKIEMEWEWIPLLDFAYCLQMIAGNLKENDIGKEYFEFTENAETLNFSRQGKQLKIIASFSSIVIETTFEDFEKAAYDFHFIISEYIRKSTLGDPPTILQKYLSGK